VTDRRKAWTGQPKQWKCRYRRYLSLCYYLFLRSRVTLTQPPAWLSLSIPGYMLFFHPLTLV